MQNDRPDLHPTFWSNYEEPDELQRAIMYPLNDPMWQDRVITAFASRKKKGSGRARRTDSEE